MRVCNNFFVSLSSCEFVEALAPTVDSICGAVTLALSGFLSTNFCNCGILTTGLAVALLLPDMHYERLISVSS